MDVISLKKVSFVGNPFYIIQFHGDEIETRILKGVVKSEN